MIAVDLFAGRKVALIGLAGSGMATAKALLAGGATVLAHDDNPDRLKAAEAAGITPAEFKTADWSDIAALILAPGVPLTHPTPHWSVDLAETAGVEIIGDLELFFRMRRKLAPDAPVVAITGTNGKSTTTALTAHVFEVAGYDVQMGGNIGTPVLDLAPPDPGAAGRVYVLEMSSYQIDLAPSADPTVGILLNLSPDHLDRHGTMQHYADVKERLVAGATGMAVVGTDDGHSETIAERLAERSSPVGVERLTVTRADTGAWRMSGARLYAPWVGEPFADLSSSVTLRGAHNGQNALAASAAARHLGLADPEIAAGLESFGGLAHRMQPVGRRGRVIFVNDSKATNADAAARALAAYDVIYWIAGGVAKTGGITSLTKYFTKIRHSYLIGEASDPFAETLAGAPGAVSRCQSLKAAVQAAAADAGQDDANEVAVLLSPACASFDQFANFEVRGDAFRQAVSELDGVELI